jgi:WhiB family redox-sensing transcriptional regulator
MITTESWEEAAACREPGIDPELFFPVSETGLSAGEVTAAKAICGRCLVTAQCLDWALRVGEQDGVWGATTPQERRLLRRDRPQPSRRHAA